MSKSSKVDVLPESFIGDGPSAVANGRIQVKTSSPAWSDSSSWRVKEFRHLQRYYLSAAARNYAAFFCAKKKI
jgi:hypothetical protein